MGDKALKLLSVCFELFPRRDSSVFVVEIIDSGKVVEHLQLIWLRSFFVNSFNDQAFDIRIIFGKAIRERVYLEMLKESVEIRGDIILKDFQIEREESGL